MIKHSSRKDSLLLGYGGTTEQAAQLARGLPDDKISEPLMKHSLQPGNNMIMRQSKPDIIKCNSPLCNLFDKIVANRATPRFCLRFLFTGQNECGFSLYCRFSSFYNKQSENG